LLSLIGQDCCELPAFLGLGVETGSEVVNHGVFIANALFGSVKLGLYLYVFYH